MPISPDIRRAIEIIDQRISSLVKIKEMLIKEFEVDQEGLAESVRGPKKTRKESLVEFLKMNGPTLWKDILSRTGMPRGTLASVLNDKKIFLQLEDGKWDLVK